jgi:hypothetical protein
MLRNKKAIYLLIPVNVLIWGFFIYRFYTAFNESDVPVSESGLRSSVPVELKDSTAYLLNLEYKDPFLKATSLVFSQGSVREASPQNTAVKKQTPERPKAEPVAKQQPDIKYLGLIKNTSSGLSAALVSVNGQSRLIKQSESVDGIVFKTLSRDSLVARWGKERIVVRK